MATKIVIIVMAFATALGVATAISVEKNEAPPAPPRGTSSVQHSRQLLAQGDTINPRAQLTCDVYPRVCWAAGSPGPDCCGKDCFDVTSDVLNCGRCGRKCAYGEACCGGSCVNVQFDPRNCGRCRNRCKKGGDCKYGMCDYA